MKRILCFMLCFFMFLSLPAYAEEEEATAMISVPVKDVHGIWLSFNDYGKLGLTIADGEDAYRDAAEVFLSDMDTCGINTVFLHERAFDDAFWRSSTFKASPCLGADASLTAAEAYPFDPAGIFLEEAHKMGISVHAWLNPYRVTKDYYYDPAEEETIGRLMTAVTELLAFESSEGEKFDGIHLDDYFYHAPSGYVSVNDPGHAHAVTISAEEKRANVNGMVRRVYKTVHEYGKTFGISPAGNYENDMNGGADIDTWLSEEGYIDYLVPQIYWTNSYGAEESIPKFTETLSLFLEKRKNNAELYAGLALYRAGSVNSSDTGWSEENTNIRDQVLEAEEAGCDGYVFFSASSFYESVIAEEVNNYRSSAGEIW